MKTLYVSDLDGTLLTSRETISDYTKRTINRLTEQGMCFSYATARSFVTAGKLTKDLHSDIPAIVYNGAFIVHNKTGEILDSNYLNSDITGIFADLFYNEVFPIVYSYINGAEKFSFVPSKCTRGMRIFLETRQNDVRRNPVNAARDLMRGDCFYITCIDEPEKLEPLYEKYRDAYHCVYSKDIYSGEQWLEIMPRAVSKSNAVLRLKQLLQCDRVVVFGDGKNDIDMFEAADECYAVENAVDELKEKATAVIGNHDEDGVAKWLASNGGHVAGGY